VLYIHTKAVTQLPVLLPVAWPVVLPVGGDIERRWWWR
jgi:hypothetical protein